MSKSIVFDFAQDIVLKDVFGVCFCHYTFKKFFVNFFFTNVFKDIQFIKK